jgi:hypothetical protein
LSAVDVQYTAGMNEVSFHGQCVAVEIENLIIKTERLGCRK